MDENAFLDQLYSAPTNPDLWIPVMEQLADMMGGSGVWLSSMSVVDGGGGGLLARVDPRAAEVFFSYYASRNPLNIVADPDTYFAGWRPMILTDEDWMPKDEFVRTEYYNDFMLPQKVDSTAMIRLATRGQTVSVINVGRATGRGRFERTDLDAAAHFHPHFIRAFKLTEELAQAQTLSQNTAALFDSAAQPLFILDRTGRVIRLNRAAESLIRMGMGLSIRGGLLKATAQESAGRLSRLIAAAGAISPEPRTGGFMALSVPDRVLPFSVTVAPVAEGAAGFFSALPGILVTVTDLQTYTPPSEQKIRELFGLTSAETRVALALLDGAALKDAAAELGISINTANVHLSRIFLKTGVNRQSALISLLMRVSGAGGQA